MLVHGRHRPGHAGRDARICIATAYRYLHEASDVIAETGPDLHEALEKLRHDGEAFACLDGTPIPTRALHAPGPNGTDL